MYKSRFVQYLIEEVLYKFPSIVYQKKNKREKEKEERKDEQILTK